MNPTRGHDLELEDKVRFLSLPASYPEGPARVEPVETHMSWVFLTDRYAYKLKKPVRYAYLDFASVSARKTFCEAEVRLNRRLAPSVYLGTVALTLEADGRLALSGLGVPVDWLVRMRRLEAAHTLERCIETGSLLPQQVEAVALLLAHFYKTLPRVPLASPDYLARFSSDIEASCAELARPGHRLDGASLLALGESQRYTLATLAPTIAARASQVVEGHGDLRPEHVWIEDPPVIIDCLEFNRDLRLVDPLDDLGFLTLECMRLGRPDLHATMFAIYAQVSGDSVNRELVRFYQSCRASLRARLAIQHLREERFRTSNHWRKRAQTYVELALALEGTPAVRSDGNP